MDSQALLEAVAAAEEGATTSGLAGELGSTTTAVRNELLKLEKTGVVQRTGKKRGKRWHLMQ